MMLFYLFEYASMVMFYLREIAPILTNKGYGLLEIVLITKSLIDVSFSLITESVCEFQS